MSAIAQQLEQVGADLEDALRQVTERQGNHEGRLKLLEQSESSDVAFVKEQLRDIKTVLDILLKMAKADEEAHG